MEGWIDGGRNEERVGERPNVIDTEKSVLCEIVHRCVCVCVGVCVRAFTLLWCTSETSWPSPGSPPRSPAAKLCVRVCVRACVCGMCVRSSMNTAHTLARTRSCTHVCAHSLHAHMRAHVRVYVRAHVCAHERAVYPSAFPLAARVAPNRIHYSARPSLPLDSCTGVSRMHRRPGRRGTEGGHWARLGDHWE